MRTSDGKEQDVEYDCSRERGDIIPEIVSLRIGLECSHSGKKGTKEALWNE